MPATDLGEPSDEEPLPPLRKRALKALEAMESNPRADWTIDDIGRVARGLGLRFSPPTSGSHYKVSSEHVDGLLVVPARKPIKPPYIRDFCGLCRAHINYAMGKE
ncbi:hypothetical protein [Acuticoccus yangtzensis]|uniref:hypothetical protein n=1 Tax=Acuticoccus yangtzensis TaxID=1443441 RepID=UPI00196A8139|nr:hypothetical protein [Acuticoccus yangtzensis]